MNIKSYSLDILVKSIIVLAMLLILFGVYSYFFEVKDYTLIAGIIAFSGSIIGGAITLIGVTNTINENRKKDIKTELKHDLEVMLETLIFLKEIMHFVSNSKIIDAPYIPSMKKCLEMINNFRLQKHLILIDKEIDQAFDDIRKIASPNSFDFNLFDYTPTNTEVFTEALNEISKCRDLVELKIEELLKEYKRVK